jgi:hypothetical protein
MNITDWISLSLALYGLLVAIGLWKRIAIFQIVAILPLIHLIVLFNTDALILSIGLGALIVVHIFIYADQIS